MLQVAFAGTFAARLEQPARRHLTVRCEIIASDEDGIIPRFGEVDVLVAIAFILFPAVGSWQNRRIRANAMT